MAIEIGLYVIDTTTMMPAMNSVDRPRASLTQFKRLIPFRINFFPLSILGNDAIC
jgi:hypothetical protein